MEPTVNGVIHDVEALPDMPLFGCCADLLGFSGTMPAVDAPIVPSRNKPGGIGEVAVLRTVASSVMALTGQRLRERPLRLRAEA